MADESHTAQDSPALNQGLADLRQTWDHLAREIASGVPELPGVIEQELAGLTLPDLNEETLMRVSESVVARVVDAGFPNEATALFRRMGRAMYELLLLMATQEEIREMHVPGPPLELVKPPSVAPTPPVAAAISVLRPPALPDPSPKPSPEPLVPTAGELGPPPATPEVAVEPVSPPPVVARPVATVQHDETPGPLPQDAQTVSAFEPRDPIRPALHRNRTLPGAVTQEPTRAEPSRRVRPAQPSRPRATSPTEAVPVPGPATPAAATAKAEALPSAAAQVPGPPVSIQQAPPAPSPANAPPSEPPAAQDPPSAPPPAALPEPETSQAPESEPIPGPTSPVEPAPVPSASPAPDGTPRPAPMPTPRELTEAEAPLWGFDPAAREPEVQTEPAKPLAPKSPPVPATVAAAPPPAAAAPATRLGAAPQSGWTVRLSPRTSTERERKLTAREAQLPELVEEIVATAKSQQAGLSSRGTARRALTAAQGKLPLADSANSSNKIQALLANGELEEAATLAVQMATTVGGEEAAGLACTVGEGVKQAKHVELAVLCFTTAVLCFPPCDRACWQLCNLSVERRDAVMAPVWLEFVARLLRARGADIDAISVYRQLLKLTPRRADLRELLRTSSLTGVLPD
ncbi:MAG: hypothetical protein WA751_10765 [Candidatus Dormiibacterota bacterium]